MGVEPIIMWQAVCDRCGKTPDDEIVRHQGTFTPWGERAAAASGYWCRDWRWDYGRRAYVVQIVWRPTPWVLGGNGNTR